MGNANDGLLFNSGLPSSQGDFVPFKVSSACDNRNVYLADKVFVTRMVWHKRTETPYHEFLVFYVREQTSGDKTPRTLVITVDRCVGKRKDPESDQNKDKNKDKKPDPIPDPIPDPELSGTPLMKFYENRKPTLTPWVPPFPKDIPTLFRSSQAMHAWSSPSNQQPTGGLLT